MSASVQTDVKPTQNQGITEAEKVLRVPYEASSARKAMARVCILWRLMRGSLFSAVRPGAGDAVLVLLHGLGSNEQDLLSLAPMLGPELNVVAYRAPLAYGPGYSWFPIEFDEDGMRLDSDAALTSLDQLINELRSLRPQTTRLLLSGFSQGAIMTSGVLTQAPELLDGALLMSGRLFPPFFADAKPAPNPGLPILAQHGLYDDVLPIQGGRDLASAIAELGYKPTWREYPMAHQVSDESLRDIIDWLG